MLIATLVEVWTTGGDKDSASLSPTDSSLMKHGSLAEAETPTGQFINH